MHMHKHSFQVCVCVCVCVCVPLAVKTLETSSEVLESLLMLCMLNALMEELGLSHTQGQDTSEVSRKRKGEPSKPGL